MTRKEQKAKMIEDAEAQEDGMSIHEIAKVLGITPHAVRYIEKRALNKLKAPTEKNQKFHKYYQINFRPTETIDI
jgi:DNA-directed RNA polymerase sigma subunit (sigma70/sigma32)